MIDRVGIGWRDRIAAGIFAHLGAIDVVELIAERCDDASMRQRRSLRALGREVPVWLHGVGLGAASASPVDSRRLDRIARLCGQLDPCGWSEHLAFVRSGGCEIGHLAAPPRNAATVDGTLRNLRHIRTVIGAPPAVENIATLMAPPACSMDEPGWVAAIVAAAGVPMLLDLHNLLVNAVNFGFDPPSYLRRFPLAQVTVIHISGGAWLESTRTGDGGTERRLLDDHLHDVPDAVFEMLEVAGEFCPRPLDVILERDGRFPRMHSLLGELDRARRALAAGRRRREAIPAMIAGGRACAAPSTGPRLETLLAKLLVDHTLRGEFLKDPRSIAAREQLDAVECDAMLALDWTGLTMAAASIAAKRWSGEPAPGAAWRWLHALRSR